MQCWLMFSIIMFSDKRKMDIWRNLLKCTRGPALQLYYTMTHFCCCSIYCDFVEDDVNCHQLEHVIGMHKHLKTKRPAFEQIPHLYVLHQDSILSFLLKESIFLLRVIVLEVVLFYHHTIVIDKNKLSHLLTVSNTYPRILPSFSHDNTHGIRECTL